MGKIPQTVSLSIAFIADTHPQIALISCLANVNQLYTALFKPDIHSLDHLIAMPILISHTLPDGPIS